MLRFLNIAAILALVGSAIYAYSIKYSDQLSRRADRQNQARNQGGT